MSTPRRDDTAETDAVTTAERAGAERTAERPAAEQPTARQPTTDQPRPEARTTAPPGAPRTTPPRRARVERTTGESKVVVDLDLDGSGSSRVRTGVDFYDHMLTSLARHALLDLVVEADGDVGVDAHHTVEDVAIVLGQALRQALGARTGIARFGDAAVPLDECLVQAVVDVSGRPYCVHTGEPEGQPYALIGGGGGGVPYAGSLTQHVFETLAHHAAIALHVRVLAGRDPHHVVEAQFKAVARALRAAVATDPRVSGVPSTKGAL